MARPGPTPRERLVKTLETRQCGGSFDALGRWASHAIKEGACLWCERSINGLAYHHGLEVAL